MKILKTSSETLLYSRVIRVSGKEIGFVPTMGALHDGHLSLIDTAKKNGDFVIVSIFVNPTQFNNTDDFDQYPNQIEQDLELLQNKKVDCVFLPDVKQLYPNESSLKFDFGYLEHIMEGQFRPGHFNGVATVVSKFFNIIEPDRAYFGQKDIQQVAVIKDLVKSLSFPTDIIVVPTLREKSGLAMSSRNQRLSVTELNTASEIFKTLSSIKNKLLSGALFTELKEKEIENLEQIHGFRVEYLELTIASTLENTSFNQTGEYAICIAAFLGDVRLIDNLVFVSE